MTHARRRRRFRMLARHEALRILALWKTGAGANEGITVALVQWCLEQTGDLGTPA